MSRLKQAGLVLSGVCAGVLISLTVATSASRETAVSSLPVDETRNLSDVFNSIKQHYVEPVDDKKLINDAISGMVAGLDPHSAYLDQEAFRDMQISIKGEFGGLGIEVTMEDGLVKVVSPIEDTPAFRAGVKAGDLIFKLDDKPVRGLSLNDAVKLMRGQPKTDILVTILRKGESNPIKVKLTREVIKVRSVRSKVVEPGYGYLRVAQFQEQTTADLARHIDDLYKGGELKGLVLDLRNNPGGLIDAAVGVSAAFLPAKSLVVYSEGRIADARRKYHAIPEEYGRGQGDVLRNLPKGIKNVPMVVLVNGGSASASEIVAGALQDYNRAKILGIRSFGKGSVQSIFPIVSGESAVKLTIAKYFTPNGRSIQAKGIDPDYVVDETSNGSSEPLFREADLLRHLNNPAEQSAPAENAARQNNGRNRNGNNSAEIERFEPAGKGDLQFEQAMNLLKGLPVATRKPESEGQEPSAAASTPIKTP
ncbi:MAG: peptidase S41 [Candidatus Dactylopiibacterium carminicum]|uniref:Peptidase S41 n=1 Tax=Candidatus Dactylopiibacterium carminicum TaxID=857335 RepID=A0A272EMN9_9RHOO|nr:S41 family peptidase [Candidatus Dactylopiibacterium carminicum]KAF7597781.1 S41 family peptidase [Candidatus Dactylopiibacterium carminicum]PAS91379.1 MAG: peptidase S41 [Candidatus Dactylopiibacterium carminicum]PAS95526.1 MAG: peptidase S41 [Candidatus Dactylopiibacterium carminicum]